MDMRQKKRRGPGRQRILVISGLAILGTAMASASLAGCSGNSSSASSAAASAALGAPRAAAAAAGGSAGSASVNGPAQGSGQYGLAQNAPASGAGGKGTAQSDTSGRLVAPGQQVTYTAQLTVRAKNVGAAVSQATRIVTSSGGYVSAENAASDPDHPANATATIELKIPAVAYQSILASLSGGALGAQLSLQQQAQDVTQQVADVNSQVTSDQAAIAQLRALLGHAGSVSDLLAVQNQINQEESALEGMEAQQRALDHETAFATVTLTVLGPKAAPPKPARPAPPPSLGHGLSGGWHALRLTVDWLLAILGAVAPFAAALGVLAFLAYSARRRFRRAPAPGTAEGDGAS